MLRTQRELVRHKLLPMGAFKNFTLSAWNFAVGVKPQGLEATPPVRPSIWQWRKWREALAEEKKKMLGDA